MNFTPDSVFTLITAIDRADDAPGADRSLLRHFDLGHMRHIAHKDQLKRDAVTAPLG